MSFGQITISPTNLFVDNQSKFGTYLVINGSNTSQELSIDFVFGYSDSDEDGNRFIVYDDSVRAKQYSITDWIRAFPRNFTLQPGQRQLVRLRVNSPSTIEDGTYWARIKTASTPLSSTVETQTTDGVSATVGFKIEQVTGIYLKKGNVTTGIEVTDMSTTLLESGKLDVIADILRTGNSPFLGSIMLNVYDVNNKKIDVQSRVSTTIFFDGIYKQEIDISDLTPGDYSVEMVFQTQRNDVQASEIVQGPTTSKMISFSVQ